VVTTCHNSCQDLLHSVLSRQCGSTALAQCFTSSIVVVLTIIMTVNPIVTSFPIFSKNHLLHLQYRTLGVCNLVAWRDAAQLSSAQHIVADSKLLIALFLVLFKKMSAIFAFLLFIDSYFCDLKLVVLLTLSPLVTSLWKPSFCSFWMLASSSHHSLADKWVCSLCSGGTIIIEKTKL
jgi:hypothetical protein